MDVKDTLFRDHTLEYIGSASASGISSNYDAYKSALPASALQEFYIIPSDRGTANNSKTYVSFEAATLALLLTAYNDWRTANPTFIVVSELYATVSIGGAVTHGMIVGYSTLPYFNLFIDHCRNYK